MFNYIIRYVLYDGLTRLGTASAQQGYRTLGFVSLAITVPSFKNCLY